MVIGAERRSMNPGGWSADWSVAAGRSTTVASQVDAGDECSTGLWWVLYLHNGATPQCTRMLPVANLWHVVLAESPRLSLGNYPTPTTPYGEQELRRREVTLNVLLRVCRAGRDRKARMIGARYCG